MDTVGQRLWLLTFLHLPHAFCHGAVGKQHELLDELVGILRFLEVAACRLALLVNVEAQLLAVELHGTVFESCGTQSLGESVESDELPCIFSNIVLAICRKRSRFAGAVNDAVLLQNVLNLLVGKASVALYHAVYKSPAQHLALFVHVEDNAVCQFLFVGTQRTDVVTQSFRKHRYGAVYEIYACGALHRLLVYHGAFGDIVRHVGNVYSHFP